MRVFQQLRWHLAGRLVFLVATVSLTLALLAWTDFRYLTIAIASTVPVQVWHIIYVAERTQRDMLHFLTALRQEDFTQVSTANRGSAMQQQLAEAFADVLAQFRQMHLENAAQAHLLQTVMQHVGVAVLAYEEGGKVVVCNAAARRLLDVPALKSIADLEAQQPEAWAALRAIDARGHGMVPIAFPHRDLQLAVGAATFKLRGMPIRLLTMQDIGNELDAKELDAWQELTRVLTHEIMNAAGPIASLASTAQHRVQRAPSPAAIADVEEALQAIERRSASLMRFSETWRSFSSIEKPVLAWTPAREVIASVTLLLRRPFEEKGITLAVDIVPHDLDILLDAELIEQILINLLLNALDAVEGRPHPEVRLTASIDVKGHPAIQVYDNGVGIPQELQSRIFTPFFTTKPHGSGIGLSLARQIMRMHGGRLSLRSEPNAGTTFLLAFRG